MVIELSTEPSTVETDPSRYIMTIYGGPKIGKTTTASHIPNAYFIATEAGQKFVKVFKSEPKDWEDVLEIVNLLFKGGHPHKTGVFDTANVLYDMCANYVCRKNPWKKVKHLSELGYGKGYTLVKEEFRYVIQKLTSAGMGIVFLCHSHVKEETFHGIKRDRIVPNLNKSARETILDISDIIGRMYAGSVEKEGKQEPCRFITFQPNQAYEAGDRTGKLEKYEKIALESPDTSWKTIVDHFQGD